MPEWLLVIPVAAVYVWGIRRIRRRLSQPPRRETASPRRKSKTSVRVTVAGRPYTFVYGAGLRAQARGAEALHEPWESEGCWEAFRDGYGRDMLYSRELFPCFDSFDRLHEDRHYHQFLVFHGDGVSAVYLTDESTAVRVTDGVRRGDVAKALQLDSWALESLMQSPYWARIPE